MFLTEDEV